MFNQSDCVLCGVCRQGIEPVPPAARSEERATSERGTSGKLARRSVRVGSFGFVVPPKSRRPRRRSALGGWQPRGAAAVASRFRGFCAGVGFAARARRCRRSVALSLWA